MYHLPCESDERHRCRVLLQTLLKPHEEFVPTEHDRAVAGNQADGLGQTQVILFDLEAAGEASIRGEHRETTVAIVVEEDRVASQDPHQSWTAILARPVSLPARRASQRAVGAVVADLLGPGVHHHETAILEERGPIDEE
jgi:hypothetical protein